MAVKAKRRARAVTIERDRASFKSLILGNPNYFGTWPAIGTKAVKLMSQKTTYEQLTCLGLHPQGDPAGGFTQVEIRAFHEMALGAGASEAVVWQGRSLTDQELLARDFPSGGQRLS